MDSEGFSACPDNSPVQAKINIMMETEIYFADPAWAGQVRRCKLALIADLSQSGHMQIMLLSAFSASLA
jgi:hypothetical protein